MEMKRPSAIASFLLFFCSTVVAGGGSIAGRVTGKGETELLVGVNVILQGSVRGTTTNTRGEFRITDLPAGKHTLAFSLVGYQRLLRPDIAVEEGRETFVSIALTQSPVQTDQVVVTASKREQSLQEVPVSISVLDASEIRQRNSLTIDDALRYIPGVNMTGFQVNIRGSSGYSRGAGSRVLMLLDGIPFLAGDTGELNFESIPVGQVDHIEVVKGASSALYGSNALGGVINIITKSIPEIPETNVRMYGGFYNWPSHPQWVWSDHRRFFNGQSVSHAYKSGDLGVSLFFSRQLDDAYRENDYRRRYNFYVKTKEDFSPTSSLTLNFGLLYQYGGQFLYWRNLDSALVPPVQQKTDNVKSTRYYLSGLYNAVLSHNLLLTGKAIWNHNDWGYETINQIGRNESVSDELNAEAHATLLLDEVHSLAFGLDGTFTMVNADLFGFHQGGGLAFYAQDEMKLSTLFTLTLGARYDFQSIGLSEPAGQLNPKAGLTYAPAASTTVRASLGRGFRVPSVAEAFITGEVSNLATLPNKNLKPERSYSYEIGLSQTFGGVGSFDLAAFRSDFNDLIEAGLVVSSSSIPYIQWNNVTKARVQGIETSFKVGLFDGGLLFSLGYTYVYPEDLTNHDLLKYRPRHLLYTSAVGRIGPITAGADFRYVSKVDRIDMELVELAIVPDGDELMPIYVADFRLGADFTWFGLPLTATFNINNAFQHNYVELIGNIMPPRTYVLILEAKL
jgi:iron complex outermembrane receptor protein